MTQALQTHKGRTSIVFVTTTALLVASAVLSLAIGARALSLEEIWHGITGSDPVATAVIWQLRFPRTLLGLLVGAALGAAGVLAQAVTRNPLADPGLLGISSGAAVSIVAGTAFLGIGGGAGRMALAIVGAALATLIVFAFAARSPEGLSPVSMTLAGMAITACLGAVVSAIVLLDAESMDQYRFWQVGALGLPDPQLLWIGAGVAVLGAIVAIAIAGSLGALALGDDTASALGVKVGRTRVLAGIAVVLLSGMAVSLAGPIGFIGLIIPHAARALVGHDVRRMLALSALLGPLLLTAADLIGRVVVRPSELQVGVVTAVIGTPVFIWLTRRVRSKRGA